MGRLSARKLGRPVKIDLELAKPALLFQHLSTHLWWSWPRIISASRYMGFIEVATSCFLVTGMQTSCCATLSSWFPVASLAQQQNHEVAKMTLPKACLSSICNFAISASRCLGTQNRGVIVMSGKAVFTRFGHSERLNSVAIFSRIKCGFVRTSGTPKCHGLSTVFY